MMNQEDEVRRAAMVASEAVADGQAGYLATVEALLTSLLGGALVLWNGIDVETHGLTLAGSSSDEWRWLLPALGATIDVNPLVRLFLSCSTIPPPIRMSDLVERRVLRAGRLYSELWRPMGTESQLALPTAGVKAKMSRGWAVNRGLTDFTDLQLETVTALQPALCALEDIVQWRGIHQNDADVSPPSSQFSESAPSSRKLTSRESEVLDLIALGWTATHIAHYLRISVSTVRKHVEHIYSKLGAHDRLTAVIAARKI